MCGLALTLWRWTAGSDLLDEDFLNVRMDDGGEGDARRGGGRNTSSGRRAISPKINPGIYTVRRSLRRPPLNTIRRCYPIPAKLPLSTY